MQISNYKVYDIKYVSAKDLNYNPSLGTGRLQIRDIHYVEEERKTTEEFIKIIDDKHVKSKGVAAWSELAEQHGWTKETG